jgi:2-polyprenyl-3-methyl-5-hydroxy-6-metoxy-1,4-benzoquinol methylase
MAFRAKFDQYSVSYRDMLQDSFGLLKIDNQVFDLIKIYNIKRYVIKRSKIDILDFGCGIGKLTGLLAKNFQHSNVVGYDISEESLAVAAKENSGVANILFVHKITLDRKYDYIIVSNVFHHIDYMRHEQTLHRLKQRLKSKGKIVFFEHNPFNLLTRLVVARCPFDKDAKLLRVKRFKELAMLCGMRLDLKNYILFFPWQSKRSRILETYLRFIPLGAQYMLTLVNK